MNRRLLTIASLLAVLALGAAVSAGAAQAEKPKQKRAFEKLTYPKLNEIKAPQVVRETLPNGMKLILVEDHSFPVVEFKAFAKGGTLGEPKGKAGLTELFGQVHRSGGVKSMSGDKVDDLLEKIGASIETGAGGDRSQISCKTLTENLDQVLPLFAEFCTDPAFSEDKLDLGKTHLRGMISRRNDNVMGILVREFQKIVYGKDSPYVRQFEYDDVEGLTRDDLVAFHKKFYRPDGIILAAWGDFKAPEMKEKLAKAFAGWKAEGPKPELAQPFVFPPAASVNYAEKQDVEQAFLLLGHLAMRMDDPDYPAVNLLSDILGGGMSSRIFKDVRENKGLAYSAGGAIMPAYDHEGSMYIFCSTKPATMSQALDILIADIKQIQQEPVTDEELDRAKSGYLNSYAFQFDSTGKIVERLMTYDFYGYPADFNVKLRDRIEKVTKEDILAAAKKHLHPEALSIMCVGRAEQFDKPLSNYGKVNTLDVSIPEPKPKETVPDPTPETLAKGKELLTKVAVAAGEPALKGLKDIYTEGSFSIKTPMGMMDLKGKSTIVFPDKIHVALTTPMGEMLQVLSGDSGWMQMGPQSQDMPGEELKEMKRGLWTELGCLLLLKEALAGKVEAQYIGKADFEGQQCDEVLARLPVGNIKLYISPDGKQIAGTKKRVMTQEGPTEMTEIFGGFQTVSGLRLPFESTQKEKGEVASSGKVATVKVNAGCSPDLFKRPEKEPAK